MNKLFHFIISVLITIAIAFTNNGMVYAKKVPKMTISPKKVSIYAGSKKEIKIRHKSKGKVKWKVKGKKHIKLTKRKAKSVTVKGVKAGKAKVYAVIGKKKLTCSVTVKSKTEQKAKSAISKNNSYNGHFLTSNTVIYSDCNDSLTDFPEVYGLLDDFSTLTNLTSSKNDALKNGKGIVFVMDVKGGGGNVKETTWTSSDTSIIEFQKADFSCDYSYGDGNGHINWCPTYRIKNPGTCTITVKYKNTACTGTVTVKPSSVYYTAQQIAQEETNQNMSDMQKAAHLAKWIMQNVKYKTLDDRSMANIFYNHEGACGEYTQAYAFLCSFAGLKSREMRIPGHAWGQVQISGKWYNVDLAGLANNLNLPVFFSNKEYYSHWVQKNKAFCIDRSGTQQPYDLTENSDTGSEYDFTPIKDLL